jgi:hypothetical protein
VAAARGHGGRGDEAHRAAAAGGRALRAVRRGRAGRLVRTVAERESFGAGANLVRWDGRDRDGVLVEDGIYLVTVAALGETRTQTLAVVK